MKEKNTFLRKVLAHLEQSTIDVFLKKLRKVAFAPEKIVPLFEEFEKKYQLETSEKLKILKEVKKLNLIRIDVPEMVPEWKKAVKKWGLANFKII